MNKAEYKSPTKTEKIKSLKYANQRAVLYCLQHFGVLSVSDLSEMVHLSKTTIAQMLYSLADKQIVFSVGKGCSTREGGKKPELFRFNADFMYSLAIGIYSNCIDLAVLNLDSAICFRIYDKARTFNTYEESIDLIAAQVEEALRDNGINPARIFSVSLCTEGVIDAKDGIVRYPIHHDWPRNMHLAEDVGARLPFRPNAIFVDSPSAFMGYAELMAEKNATLEKIVCLYTGISAAGCILNEQRIQHGANGFIGEFGHFIVDPNSRIVCSCGGTGCFESLVSVKTVLADAAQATGNDSLTIDNIMQDYRSGKAYAVEEIGRVIHWFSVLINNMILVHDPDKIIILGTYAAAGPGFIAALKEQINAFPFYKIKRDLDIEFGDGNIWDSCLIGAAHHSFHHFLQTLDIHD